MCVAKVIACVLIASIFMDTITAAPLPDDTTQSPTKTKNTRNSQQRRKGNPNLNGKKSLDRRRNLFSDKEAEAWRNACNSIGWVPEHANEQNQNVPYETIKLSLELSVKSLNSSMARMDKINTTDIKSWEEFNNQSYVYLPTRPTGIAHKWFEHTQIYVASFTLLHKFQLQKDVIENNNTISSELKDILDRARLLLCDIEHFVNATSNKNGNYRPYWFDKEEMAQIVTLKKKNLNLLNNLFVKARFQHYVERLHKRIEHFKLEKNMEPKSLKSRRISTLKPRKNRKNNRVNRRRITSEDYTGEPTTTEKTFIITTKKLRRNTKVPRHSTRIPGQQRKHNRINQKLQ